MVPYQLRPRFPFIATPSSQTISCISFPCLFIRRTERNIYHRWLSKGTRREWIEMKGTPLVYLTIRLPRCSEAYKSPLKFLASAYMTLFTLHCSFLFVGMLKPATSRYQHHPPVSRSQQRNAPSKPLSPPLPLTIAPSIT